jgi:hypothetical protein
MANPEHVEIVKQGAMARREGRVWWNGNDAKIDEPAASLSIAFGPSWRACLPRHLPIPFGAQAHQTVHSPIPLRRRPMTRKSRNAHQTQL